MLSTKKFSIWGPIGESRPGQSPAAGNSIKSHMGSRTARGAKGFSGIVQIAQKGGILFVKIA
jgi:hypothetical protein